MRSSCCWLLVFPAVAGAEPRTVVTEVGAGLDGIVVAEVAWTGANVTRDFVIERELELREGEPFDGATLAADVERLHELGVFARIETSAEAGADGVRVRYDFKEMPSYIPYVAVSYTEENGWSVGPAVMSVNLFGRGIQMGARALFGGASTFELNGRHPWIGGHHVSLDLRAAGLVRDDTIRGFEERSVELTPWLGRYWGRRGRIQGMLGWFRMRSDVPGVTLSSRNVDDWGRAGIRAGWDSRDSRILPRDGWWSEVEVIQNGGFLWGEADFVAGTTDVQRYVPLGTAASLALGGLLTVQSGTLGGALPSYMDFRMGGANTIRGYAFDVLGRELSGKNELLFTAELRRPLVPVREIPIASWSFRMGVDAALFVDTGAAWSGELDGDRFRTGGGFGIRIVGIASEMLRFDVGFGDEMAEFHFAAWSKFTAQRRRLR